MLFSIEKPSTLISLVVFQFKATLLLIKEALKDFDGTLILVSHDRDFLDGLAEKVFEFGNKRVKEHFEDIKGFLAHKKMENLKEIEK